MYPMILQFDFYTLMILGLITLAVFVTVYILLRKKYLSKEQAKLYCKQIQTTSKLVPSHSLKESHKILVSAVSEMQGKKANAAKLLNRIKSRVLDEKEMWFYHSMRNRAAHEVNFKVSENDAKKARKVFKNVLEALVK